MAQNPLFLLQILYIIPAICMHIAASSTLRAVQAAVHGEGSPAVLFLSFFDSIDHCHRTRRTYHEAANCVHYRDNIAHGYTPVLPILKYT